MFVDFADGGSFKQIKVPIRRQDKGQRYILHEDIKMFMIKELKRSDLYVISPIFLPIKYFTSLLILKTRKKARKECGTQLC
ncbi:MAG: hypothetical protein QXN96_00020 [Candidatus Bathyarchaeia archaeon]